MSRQGQEVPNVLGIEADEHHTDKHSGEGQEVEESNPEEEKVLSKDDRQGERPDVDQGEAHGKRPREDGPEENRVKRAGNETSGQIGLHQYFRIKQAMDDPERAAKRAGGVAR